MACPCPCPRVCVLQFIYLLIQTYVLHVCINLQVYTFIHSIDRYVGSGDWGDWGKRGGGALVGWLVGWLVGAMIVKNQTQQAATVSLLLLVSSDMDAKKGGKEEAELV